jgi:large subunit ribosomal protein L15
MNLGDIHKAAPPRKKKFLSGRGRASGLGKTSGVGGKGQWGRQGAGFRPYFEGGQMPLIRRIPKRGFSNNAFRTEYELVTLGDLDKHFNAGETVDAAALRAKHLLRRDRPVKVVSGGKLTKKLEVKVDRFTASAAEAVAKAGGTAVALNPAPPPRKPSAPPAGKAETKGQAPASKPEAAKDEKKADKKGEKKPETKPETKPEKKDEAK